MDTPNPLTVLYQDEQLLAATRTAFPHPASGEPLTISAPPEESFLEVLSVFPEFEVPDQSGK